MWTNNDYRRLNSSASHWWKVVIGLLVLSGLGIRLLYAPEPGSGDRKDYPAKPSQPGLSVLSWNIAMLPVIDRVATEGGRAERIGQALLDQSNDILVFQEAFTAKARRTLYKALHRDYPYEYGPANSRFSLKLNSGLWVLSKIPLTVIKELQFRSGGGLDRLSRKGAILLEGMFNGTTFHLIGTHLDSNEEDPEVRFAQLEEIRDVLLAPFSHSPIPMLICGDFNTDRNQKDQYDSLLTILDCEDGVLTGETQVTFGFQKPGNNPESMGEKPRQLDYIFTRNGYSLWTISRTVAIIQETESGETDPLSDHYGIEARIEMGSPSR